MLNSIYILLNNICHDSLVIGFLGFQIKGLLMRVSVNDFLNGLKINREYFFKQLLKIGVSNRHILDFNDIQSIKSNFPARSYITVRVVERCNDFLGGIK